MPSLRALASAVVSLALAGCVLDPVPLQGLTCPCAAPFVCDEVAQRCVERVGMVCGRAGVPEGALSVRLEHLWSASHQAQLEWEIDVPARVSEFAVDVARSADALRAGEIERTIDGETNHELGRGALMRTAGLEWVTSTLLRDLEPGRAYAVRLLAYDVEGALSCSSIVPFRTNYEPRNELTYFDETLRSGMRVHRPCTEILRDPELAAEGEAVLAHSLRCEQPPQSPDGGTPVPESVCTEPVMVAPECWENVGLVGGAIDISALGEGDRATAYIEAAVAIDDDRPAFWVEAHATFDENARLFRLPTFTLSSGPLSSGPLSSGETYQLIQLPLRALERDCRGASGECTWNARFCADSGSTTGCEPPPTSLAGFRVGTQLSHGARMRIDSIRLRW